MNKAFTNYEDEKFDTKAVYMLSCDKCGIEVMDKNFNIIFDPCLDTLRVMAAANGWTVQHQQQGNFDYCDTCSYFRDQ